jgi:hypothetical protein
MWCVSLKFEKAKRAGNVLTTIFVGEFLEKKGGDKTSRWS